ncbi:stage V sporulation protein T [Lachnospiraceae bacterium 42-17]|jgi:AbrB family transcriptional regulator (stage V sporulation protein T)|nr:stage V sporulation protein T [Dorea sp.]
MKATGIVRRIDDLGRVVIPKEIRRTLRIREGDPLEIFTDREGEIILKKYSPIGELSVFAKQYAESLSQTMGCLVCVCDMDQIIAAAGSGKKDVQEKYISKSLQKELESRNGILAAKGDKKYVKVIAEQEEDYEYEAITPIICEGDVIGGVLFLSKEEKKKLGDTEEKMAACAAAFLGRQMEQ